MPQAWVKNGGSYQLQCYINDDEHTPKKIKQAERLLSKTIEDINSLGVIVYFNNKALRDASVKYVIKEG